MKAYYLYQSAELGLCYGEVSGSEHGLDTVATLAEHRDGEAAEAGRGQGEGGEEEAGQLEAGPGQQQQAGHRGHARAQGLQPGHAGGQGHVAAGLGAAPGYTCNL